MPKAQDKYRILAEAGVDPSKYWINDSGDIVDLPEQGTAETALKSTLYNAPRTALGFTGGALGATGAAALAAPSGPGAFAAGVAGSVAGGAAGSMAGQKLMDAIYPESWRLGEEAREVRSPGTVKLADIAATTAMMRPSPTVLKQVARAPMEFIKTGGQIQPQTAAGLMNVGVGAGLGGGMAAAQGGTAGDIATEALIGGLQHQPTALGRAMSFGTFHPSTDIGAVAPGNMPTEAARRLYADRLAQEQQARVEEATKRSEVAAELLRNFASQQKANARRKGSIEKPLAEKPIAPIEQEDLAARLAESGEVPGIEKTVATPPPAETEITAPRGASEVEQRTKMMLEPQLEEYLNDWGQKFNTVLSKVHDLKASGETIPRTEAGGESRININATRAYVDVQPHEALHSMLHDALNFGSAREQKFVRRALEAQGVKPTKGEDGLWFIDPQAEERLVKPVGEAAFEQMVDPAKKAEGEHALADFMDYYLRNKMTPEAASRLLRNRLVFGSGAPSAVKRAQLSGRMPTLDERREDLESATQEALAKVAPEEARPEEAPIKPEVKAGLQEERPLNKVELPETLSSDRGIPADVVARIKAKRAADQAEAQAFEEAKRGGRTVREEEGESRLSIGEVLEAARQRERADVERRIRSGEAPGTEVSRPEVIDYTGESIPRNVRRGRMERESAMETPEDLEMRRIEDRMAGRSRSRYQEFEGDRTFATDFEKELTKPRPWNIQVAKDGRMSARDVDAAVKKLSPTEQEMLKEAGLGQFLSKLVRPNAAELRKWAEENVPRVEVKELSADGNDTPEQKAYAKLRHEYDTLGKFPEMVYDNRATGEPSVVYYSDTASGKSVRVELDPNSPEFQKALEWERLGQVVANQGGRKNDSATRSYTQVNPRELKDMPGAVDLLVRYPRMDYGEFASEEAARAQLKNHRGPFEFAGIGDYPGDTRVRVTADRKYGSHHYPKSGDNLLAHVRAYEHTMPNGEKVLRVFEVQSDWAQARRKFEAAQKGTADSPRGWGTTHTVGDDPLLAHHQRLALKAAIEHARRRGISKVVVDDAETAMLTEGHDMHPANIAEPGDYNVNLSTRVGTLLDKITIPKNGKLYDAIAYRKDGSTFKASDRLSDETLQLIYDSIPHKSAIPQERGMRLAYDNVLQQHMRDLAGEGTKVDLGLHKNAVDQIQLTEIQPAHGMGFGSRREAEAFVRDNPSYTLHTRTDPLYGEIHEAWRDKPKALREDLIFRNPDGTPKTHSTGFMYDVSAPQERRAAGEPFSYTGRRYQPLGPDRAEYKGEKLPERETRFPRVFAGNVEVLRKSGDPEKVKFADRAVELYAAIRNYTGRYEDAMLRKFLSADAKTRTKVVETMYDEDQSGTTLRSTLSPKEAAVYDEVREGLKLMRREQIAANQLIDGRPAKMDPTYFPNAVDRTIIHDLTNNPTSARAQTAERHFVDFNKNLYMRKGMSAAEAEAAARKAFGKFVGSLKPMSIDSGFDFGAVSLPSGTKLPPTWIAADPVQGFRNYIKRFARARAFYDIIGRDEDAMRSIGRKFYYDAAGKQVDVRNPGSRIVRDPNVRTLLESAIGVTHESQEGVTPAIGRLANTLLLSNVMSRLTDVSTTPFKALTYIPATKVPGLLLNLRNIRQSIDNAYRTGGARRGDLMVVRDVLGAGDAAINKIDKISEFINKWTGSELIEKGSRMLAQNVGEYVYDVNKQLADKGDRRARMFFERMTPKWQTIPREEMAQRIAQLFQGSYDATNLPIWIQNSPAAPFFSMMKWNVEQWNNFKRHAWEPARQGDVMPLVGTMLGGLVGGIAVGELREAISGKKQRVANFDELRFGFEKGDKTRAGIEAMRKAAFIAQVTGTLGVIGELNLQAMDIAAKDKPQGFSWPAYDLASNILTKTQNAAAGMIERPKDAGMILGAVVHDLTRDVFSQYRLASAAADRLRGEGETQESNRRRDLRMSEKLRGEPIRQSPMVRADYRNAAEHAFDRERDMAKARERAAGLRQTVREESKTREEREAAIRKLKASRISGIPSKENSPQQFRAHIGYIRATQGDEAARALMQDYNKLRREQQIKARMIR